MNGIFEIKYPRNIRILITRAVTILPCYLIVWLLNVEKIMNALNIFQAVSLPFVIIPLIKFAMCSTVLNNYIYSSFKMWLIIVLSFIL